MVKISQQKHAYMGQLLQIVGDYKSIFLKLLRYLTLKDTIDLHQCDNHLNAIFYQLSINFLKLLRSTIYVISLKRETIQFFLHFIYLPSNHNLFLKSMSCVLCLLFFIGRFALEYSSMARGDG